MLFLNRVSSALKPGAITPASATVVLIAGQEWPWTENVESYSSRLHRLLLIFTVPIAWETLEDAGNTLRGFYTALREVPPTDVKIDWSQPLAAKFRAAMDDDFDTPIAFAVLHELRGEVNRAKSPELSGLLKALGGTIGLLQADPAAFLQGGMKVDVQALIDERIAAKKGKDYKRADEIRKQLEAAGIALEDKPGGTTEWRKK